MKVAVLTCEILESGLLKSEAAASLVPVLEKARQVRNSGLLNGEPVKCGLVQASWQPAPAMKFRCDKPVVADNKKRRKGIE